MEFLSVMGKKLQHSIFSSTRTFTLSQFAIKFHKIPTTGAKLAFYLLQSVVTYIIQDDLRRFHLDLINIYDFF